MSLPLPPPSLLLLLLLLLLLGHAVAGQHAAAAGACEASADVVVWGGTVCGATAAVAAARTGSPSSSVLWLVNGTRLGGMTSGGLGGVDLSMKIGGLADELLTPLGRGFEPHTAEAAVQSLVDGAGERVKVVRRTGWLGSVASSGNTPRRISSVTTLTGRTFCGKVFIDCSYEGDLLRLSGTDFAVGRESRDEYNESLAGKDSALHDSPTEKPSLFDASVSPFIEPADPSSGLLPTIVGFANDSRTGGEADDWVMAMCFRMCLTNNASNAIKITAPDGYTTRALELLRREIVAATTLHNITLSMRSMFLIRELSSEKIDLNSGQWSTKGGTGGYFPFSTDLPYAQHDWPLGDAAARARVFADHKWWTQAMLYYLGNDPELRKLQPKLVAEAGSYGLCADEYSTEEPSTGHWSPQLYVRESVRLKGATVLTQHDICDPQPSATGVGLSKWAVDIHAVQRLAAQVNGSWRVINSGGRDAGRDPAPFCHCGLTEIPYEALTPRRDDTANLLVPVCVSSTHVAFATYRLEAQYAIFGHAAGAAAVLVGEGSVQDVNVTELRALLVSQKQLISAGGSAGPSPPPHHGGYSCVANRCVVGGGGGAKMHGNSSCGGDCAPLAKDEWLANDCCGIWKASSSGSSLVALKPTWLKKSEAESSSLPAAMKLKVAIGNTCTLLNASDAASAAVGDGLRDAYRLCRAGNAF
jgi:hypothetical protein